MENIPTLKVSNKLTLIVARLQRAVILLPFTQRFSLGGEAGLLVIFDDGKKNISNQGEFPYQ